MSKLGWFLGGCAFGVVGLMATAAVCAYSEDRDGFTSAIGDAGFDDDEDGVSGDTFDATTLKTENNSSMESNTTPCGPFAPTMS